MGVHSQVEQKESMVCNDPVLSKFPARTSTDSSVQCLKGMYVQNLRKLKGGQRMVLLIVNVHVKFYFVEPNKILVVI
jgi:hypothetical protein